jgi:Amt family ammonium transporter
MFAIITVALVSGAIAERMKTLAFILFILLWTTLVYDPLAHWVWGVGGFIKNLGALDFAGGDVVHISSGVSGLVAAIMLGARRRKSSITPHNIPMTLLGVGLLLFGWFGFNAGSALEFNSVAINAFITTNTSAAAAAVGWCVFEYIHDKRVSSLGIGSAIVAGLVSITPGAGYVTPLSAVFIGLIGGAICFTSVTFIKKKFGYDDALDAFGCHGVGGIWGGIATGLFATKTVNSAGANGLFYGNINLLGAQLIAILCTIIFSVVMTFIIMKVVDKLVGVRVSAKDEDLGLDISQQGEEAYGVSNL